MRRNFFLLLLIVATTANAQSPIFRHVGARHSRQVNEIQNVVGRNVPAQATNTKKSPIIDEATDLQDDVRYRYVYAYDTNKQRSSETIYKTECENGVWGGESLITVGTYSYEYDSQGRMKTKAVTYTANDDFTSYRIMAEYGDETTTYKKYMLDSSDSYYLAEGWEYYPNGVMASYTDYTYNSYTTTYHFGESGVFQGEMRHHTYDGSETGSLASGTQNDSIITKTYYGNSYALRYKYDPAICRLLEYSTYGDYSDNYKYEWEYDAFGRVVSIKYYNTGDDYDAYIGDGTVTRSGGMEPDWVLDEQQDYTYNSDDVYGIGNAWHDVLEFDGPVKAYRFWERGDEDEDFIESIAFDYDEAGKLLSATHSQTGPDTEMSTIIKTITVDDSGQITAIDQEEFFYDDEGNVDESGDYYTCSHVYTWEDGQITEAVMMECEGGYGDDVEGYVNTKTSSYTYGDGNVYEFYQWEGPNYQNGTFGTIYGEQGDGRYYEWKNQIDGSWSDTEKLIVETQKEDVIFTRPDIFKDVDGFTPERTIVASVKDRVVAYLRTVYNPGYSSEFTHDGYGKFYYSDMNNCDYNINLTDDTYFSISHDGEETICSNIDGLPVYVLQNGRLIREYVYYEEVYNVGQSEETTASGDTQTRASRDAASLDGKEYTEIVYHYNEGGLFTGQTVTEVADDGTRTEETSIEYKYDTAGIVSVDASAAVGLQLNGRHLGITDQSATFSVSTIGGMTLANNVSDYTFTTTGIYLVTIGETTVKIAIR